MRINHWSGPLCAVGAAVLGFVAIYWWLKAAGAYATHTYPYTAYGSYMGGPHARN